MKQVLHYLLLFILALFTVQIINTQFQESISFDPINKTGIWQNINKEKVAANIAENVSNTLHLYQGTGTNLCGFAAITYYLIKEKPLEYERMVTELYDQGFTITPSGRKLEPSSAILEYSGVIKGKGRLDINQADQLWFLTLADNFKGYVNALNYNYSYGDESSTWASTNLGKFNRIWHALTGKEVHTVGSDLIRPSITDYYQYIKTLLKDNTVMLYLNNTILNKRNFSSITFPIPTHFVELYDLYPVGQYYVMEYWDYGFKTKEILPQETFNEIIFGVSHVEKD